MREAKAETQAELRMEMTELHDALEHSLMELARFREREEANEGRIAELQSQLNSAQLHLQQQRLEDQPSSARWWSAVRGGGEINYAMEGIREIHGVVETHCLHQRARWASCLFSRSGDCWTQIV
tara:strand:- start:516 stop:887 length:372 start_codon:yes stop_codon:yes gene_type:complete